MTTPQTLSYLQHLSVLVTYFLYAIRWNEGRKVQLLNIPQKYTC